MEPISNQSVKSLDCGNESIERGPLALSSAKTKQTPILGSGGLFYSKSSVCGPKTPSETSALLPAEGPLLLAVGYLQLGLFCPYISDISSPVMNLLPLPNRSRRAMSLLAVARPSIEATSADCDCTWRWIKALSRSRRRCATGSTRNRLNR